MNLSELRVYAWNVGDIPDQTGRVALVTGANSGIGWHTALELARGGGEVILASRTEAKGLDAVQRIRSEVPQAVLRIEVLDLASLKSIHAFAERVSGLDRLDLLVNNAGVMSVPDRRLTEDGFELQFGTNYLGPFALTLLLMPTLLKAPSPRVTTVSSGAAQMGTGKINFDDLQWEHGYHPWKVYCQSKLADLMFSQELKRRCASAHSALLSNAAHPGYAITNLQTSGPGRPQNLLERLFAAIVSQDAAHGALPTLRAATEPDALAGSYYAPDRLFQLKGNPVAVPVPKQARDEDSARRLWEVSEKLTGVSWPE